MSASSGKFFLDTNILVYTFDPRESVKQARARELVTEALQGRGMLSSQVIQEFLNVARRKFAQPLSAALILTPYLSLFVRSFRR